MSEKDNKTDDMTKGQILGLILLVAVVSFVSFFAYLFFNGGC